MIKVIKSGTEESQGSKKNKDAKVHSGRTPKKGQNLDSNPSSSLHSTRLYQLGQTEWLGQQFM